MIGELQSYLFEATQGWFYISTTIQQDMHNLHKTMFTCLEEKAIIVYEKKIQYSLFWSAFFANLVYRKFYPQKLTQNKKPSITDLKSVKLVIKSWIVFEDITLLLDRA